MMTRQTQLRTILKDLQSALQCLYGEDVPEIMLYGSQARGDSTNESDIDVVLLFPGMVSASTEIRRLGPILADLNLRYQVLVSILPVNRDEYRHSTGAFWKNIRRDGVAVHAL